MAQRSMSAAAAASKWILACIILVVSTTAQSGYCLYSGLVTHPCCSSWPNLCGPTCFNHLETLANIQSASNNIGFASVRKLHQSGTAEGLCGIECCDGLECVKGSSGSFICDSADSSSGSSTSGTTSSASKKLGFCEPGSPGSSSEGACVPTACPGSDLAKWWSCLDAKDSCAGTAGCKLATVPGDSTRGFCIPSGADSPDTVPPLSDDLTDELGACQEEWVSTGDNDIYAPGTDCWGTWNAYYKALGIPNYPKQAWENRAAWTTCWESSMADCASVSMQCGPGGKVKASPAQTPAPTPATTSEPTTPSATPDSGAPPPTTSTPSSATPDTGPSSPTTESQPATDEDASSPQSSDTSSTPPSVTPTPSAAPGLSFTASISLLLVGFAAILQCSAVELQEAHASIL